MSSAYSPTAIEELHPLADGRLEVDVVPRSRHGIIARRQGGILSLAEANVLVHELALEFRLECRKRTDEFCTCLLEKGGRCDSAIRLDLDEEIWLERVWYFVAREENLWHRKQLSEVLIEIRE